MSTAVTQFDPNHTDTLVFTKNAARKVHELIMDEGDISLKLRVFVTGGGCSGFQYGFTFDNTVNADDTIVEQSTSLTPLEDNSDEDGGVVTLLVDALSYQYLTGAEIDYKEDIEGARFVIRNPNAQTTCGCGSSFSI